MNVITTDNFLNDIWNEDAAFLIILNQLNTLNSLDLQMIYLISIIIKFSLFNNYQDFADVFSKEKAVKLNLIKAAKYFIDLKLDKQSFYRFIYNLFT